VWQKLPWVNGNLVWGKKRKKTGTIARPWSRRVWRTTWSHSSAIDSFRLSRSRASAKTGERHRRSCYTSGSNSFKAFNTRLNSRYISYYTGVNRKGYLRNATPLARDWRAQRGAGEKWHECVSFTLTYAHIYTCERACIWYNKYVHITQIYCRRN